MWQGSFASGHVKNQSLLMERVDRLHCRFGCSASGSTGQAQDGPARAQEGRLKLCYVSLLQVQVTSGRGAVKHLLGSASGKQGAWRKQIFNSAVELKNFQNVLLSFYVQS